MKSIQRPNNGVSIGHFVEHVSSLVEVALGEAFEDLGIIKSKI